MIDLWLKSDTCLVAHIPARIIVTRAEEVKASNEQGYKQNDLDVDRTSPGRSSSANNIYNLGMISQCTQVPPQIPARKKRGLNENYDAAFTKTHVFTMYFIKGFIYCVLMYISFSLIGYYHASGSHYATKLLNGPASRLCSFCSCPNLN